MLVNGGRHDIVHVRTALHRLRRCHIHQAFTRGGIALRCDKFTRPVPQLVQVTLPRPAMSVPVWCSSHLPPPCHIYYISSLQWIFLYCIWNIFNKKKIKKNCSVFGHFLKLYPYILLNSASLPCVSMYSSFLISCLVQICYASLTSH